ncbi:MAG TPA: kynureninase, partial [Woeseiaceae bacterium]|nr:kynureninase [Woeseiaceae bacterium]
MADFDTHRDCALSMDAADQLASFRECFNFPDGEHGLGPVYLCGHSLGLQPKDAVSYVQEELDDWARLGVEGHFRSRRPWLPYHRFATAGLAALAGANDKEVVAMNTLTVNLHLLMATFYRPTAARHKILIESTAFPSDRFAAMSQIRLKGFDPSEALLEWRPRDGDQLLCVEDLQRILDDCSGEIALLLLPGVQYYNGQLLDMQDLCQRARASGCLIGLDLAHAIGNVPLLLHDWAPDFAAWCSYKYMNGGPGAVGGAFVHARHLDGDGSAQLLGWWGHAEESRFEMAPTFAPAKGAELWQLSNPPILSLAPVLASLKIFEEAGIDRLREKSLRLTAYLAWLLEERLGDDVRPITPAAARGSQLSLTVTGRRLDARDVFGKLARQDVFADWREPNVIRVAAAPLYNSFADIFD